MRGLARGVEVGSLGCPHCGPGREPDFCLGPAVPPTPTLSRIMSFPSPAPSTRQYHGVWHCIVGRNFGSYVTNEAKHYIYFYQGQIAVCLFKTN